MPTVVFESSLTSYSFDLILEKQILHIRALIGCSFRHFDIVRPLSMYNSPCIYTTISVLGPVYFTRN